MKAESMPTKEAGSVQGKPKDLEETCEGCQTFTLMGPAKRGK